MPLPERIMQRFTERTRQEVYDLCARNPHGFKTSAVKRYAQGASCFIGPDGIAFPLETAFGILLKDAECNDFFDVSERHLCYKQFRSACGVYVVFAKHGGSRHTEAIQFVRGEHDGKMYLHCHYAPNGPRVQLVYIMLVPFEKCAGCHECKAGLRMCAACKAIGRRVLYCGRDCQRAHWQNHAAVCGRE